MTGASFGLADHDWSKPVVVSPQRACELLSVGLTHLYELLNAGELDSFLIGRSRRITVVSIQGFVERELEKIQASRGAD